MRLLTQSMVLKECGNFAVKQIALLPSMYRIINNNCDESTLLMAPNFSLLLERSICERCIVTLGRLFSNIKLLQILNDVSQHWNLSKQEPAGVMEVPGEQILQVCIFALNIEKPKLI